MKYRALDSNGDYTFGQGTAEFLVNSPETVAQAVRTRLRLFEGEWFLDQTEGTPYMTQVIGTGTQTIHDQAIQERILGTQGVTSIDNYYSAVDSNTRALVVRADISTLYGTTTIEQVL